MRVNRLAEIAYDEVLGEYAVFGTPEAVADRLLALREEIGFSTLSTWMNPGGQIPNERVLRWPLEWILSSRWGTPGRSRHASGGVWAAMWGPPRHQSQRRVEK